MKMMDYTVSGNGNDWSFTALSIDAKFRTPKPTVFSSLEGAREFLKRVQAEGFLVSGAELVDSEQRPVKHGYFVRRPDGQLMLSGQDLGPKKFTVFEVGDTIAGAHGEEAVIVRIEEGDFAQKMGFGRIFVMQMRNATNV